MQNLDEFPIEPSAEHGSALPNDQPFFSSFGSSRQLTETKAKNLINK